MASLCKDKNGTRRICFVYPKGKRKTIYLGKVTQRCGLSFKVKIEDLVSAKIASVSPADDTRRWLVNLDDIFVDKLANVGLVEPRNCTQLEAYIDAFIEGRSDVKKSTILVCRRTQKHLLAYFGGDKLLRDVTEGDADDWNRYLQSLNLAKNTIRRTCGIAKQFFAAAIRAKLIIDNPFHDQKVAVSGNPGRFYYVTREEASAVIDACPDAQWRLLFALARYGGLRVPSEVLLLRWQDIDWAKGRFLVTSTKTEHHEGKATRKVPIFPELLPYLRESYELANEGDEYCITRYRDSTVNLRTQLLRIVEKAGLECWPKLWQNLRSTRETELTDDFPLHVVSAWIGNSAQVAVKHYLQVTDEHFDRAAHNPAQKVLETSRSGKKIEIDKKSKNDVSVGSFRSLHKKTASCGKQETVSNGRYRTRTCDFFLVREAL